MTSKNYDKLQLMKMIEKKKRKHCLCFGFLVGITSGCAIALCLTKLSNQDPFKKEKQYYCSKFKEIKSSICDIKNHIKQNPCCIDIDSADDSIK